jgi:hypothetical protein
MHSLAPGFSRRNGSIPKDGPACLSKRMNQRQDAIPVATGITDKNIAHRVCFAQSRGVDAEVINRGYAV